MQAQARSSHEEDVVSTITLADVPWIIKNRFDPLTVTDTFRAADWSYSHTKCSL